MPHSNLRSRTASLLLALGALTILAAPYGCRRKHGSEASASVTTARPKPRPMISEADLKKYKPNEAGAIMILMYHRFETKEPSNELNRQPDLFRKDLNDLYTRGYYPVTVLDLVTDKMDVPAGKTPVVLTFDDALPSQFKIITGADGQPHIDPDCAVGIMETFHKEHPDWPTKATFFVLPKEGKNGDPFGQAESVSEKFDYLLKSGYEIANHTSTHSSMRGMAPAKIKWELATALKDIKAINPGSQMKTMALPYGNVPSKENQKYLASGEDGGTSYEHLAVLRAAWRPVMSPVTKPDWKITDGRKQCIYDPYNLERILPNPKQANLAGTFEYQLKYFDQNPQLRYISDGNVDIVSVPKSMRNNVDTERIRKYGQVANLYGFNSAQGVASGLSVESKPR